MLISSVEPQNYLLAHNVPHFTLFIDIPSVPHVVNIIYMSFHKIDSLNN